MKIGYARVSTQDQKLDLQLKSLKKAGCQKIFREKVSGFNRQRPEFQRMLDQIRPGDIIVVWKLDRLARSTRDLLNTMDTINEAGGKFQSISEPWANTTTHAGKMIMTVFAGIAEFERDLIRERTGAGREAAKQRGVRFGRPRKLNTDQAQVAAQLLAEGKAGSRHRKDVQRTRGHDLSRRSRRTVHRMAGIDPASSTDGGNDTARRTSITVAGTLVRTGEGGDHHFH